MPEFNAHHVSEGKIICSCGKHIKSNRDVIQRIRKALDILKTPFFRASHPNSTVTSTDLNCGNSIITKQMMRCELLQGRRTEPLRIFGIDGKNDLDYSKSQEAIGWNDAFARYLEYIVQIDISHEAPAEQRGRFHNLIHLRGFEESLQGMPLIKWPGYHETKLAITEVWWPSGREMNIVHIPTKERKRLNDKLDPEIREYLV